MPWCSVPYDTQPCVTPLPPRPQHNNWSAERYGRPGDPDTVDLTFQPRINAESKRILGEGRGEGGATNSFLDRLDNDLRKRQGNKKVCSLCLSAEQ